MQRDFKKWHEKKSSLDQNEVRVNFHERDVWFSSVGANVGFEWDGKGGEFLRPIVILKKFNNETLWGIPLTSKIKNSKYYFTFGHDSRKSAANISQLRLIDAKRLRYQIGSISERDFMGLKKRIIDLIQ